MAVSTAIHVRHAAERGQTRLSWLQSWHSFSFGNYHDPRYMQFGSLRVINDDIIAPGAGFGMHPHRDMEIMTWMLDGSLRHADSMGHEQDLRVGELQVMSAGTGIRHSEFNASTEHEARLLQIWVTPRQRGLTPRYEQRAFPVHQQTNTWHTLASADGREGSLLIAQDMRLQVAHLEAGAQTRLDLHEHESLWLQVAKGSVQVEGHALVAGDGLQVTSATSLNMETAEGAEVLAFVMSAIK